MNFTKDLLQSLSTVADTKTLEREICKSSFEMFVKRFWSEVPGTGKLVWNWHLSILAKELQQIAERVFLNVPKLYDLVTNVSPGTSKSTLFSILFPAWCWARMPQARFLTASHTDELVLDLANKTRQVIKGDKYQSLFPEVELNTSQDAKGYYTNTAGGDRKTCTVAGKSPMGFHAHFIICLPWESGIITELGVLPIGMVVEHRLPVKVLAYDHSTGCVRWREIEAYEENQAKPLCQLTFDDGSSLELTEDHPVYVEGKGYTPAGNLTCGDEVYHAVDLSRLQKGFREGKGVPPDIQKGGREVNSLLQFQMLEQSSKKNQHQTLYELWQTFLSLTSPCNQKQVGLGILWEGLSRGVYEWEEASSLEGGRGQLTAYESLSSVQERVSTWGRVQQSVEDLQQRMSSKVQESIEASKIQEALCSLWGNGQGPPSSLHKRANGDLLFSGLCKQGPFQEDGGKGEFQLPSWSSGVSLLAWVSQDKRKGAEEGEESVFPLWNFKDGEYQEEFRCSSYRLRQNQPQDYKSSCSLPTLSFNASQQESSPPFKVSKKTVTDVAFSVRLPRATYNIRVAEDHNFFAEKTLVHNCDDPIDPKKVLSEAELRTAREFITNIIPSRKVDKAVTVTIQVAQRLGLGDPTEVMLKESEKEGASPVRRVCLPAELYKKEDGTWDDSNVFPKELSANYKNGMMDEKRMGRQVLNEFKARGNLYYSTQFLQLPYAQEGSMFKPQWFSKRVKAAPYHATRVRFWDRAATDAGGCWTAGVLLAKDDNGDYYIEDVIHGQWEPSERNARMRAAALRDRSRYGPNNEPAIYVEAEGGSSGRDAWKSVVKNLEGFSVWEDRPTGSKDTRAEPWASQLAAGNVYIVDQGESQGTGKSGWDVEDFINEHVRFKPDTGKRLGGQKDRVDAAAAAFNLLSGRKQKTSFRILPSLQRNKARTRKIVACSVGELQSLLVEENALLIVFTNPPIPEEVMCSDNAPNGEAICVAGPAQADPIHGLSRLVTPVFTIPFMDLDPQNYQETWDVPIPPWNLTPDKLIMTPQDGKKIWSKLLKRYDPPWEIVVFADQGDRRAMSVATAVADILKFGKECIYSPTLGENKVTDPVVNPHIVAIIKNSRYMVVE